MVTAQVELTEEQMRRLEHLAGIRNVSVSELIRLEVDKLVREYVPPDDAAWERAIAAMGRYRSGVPDLGSNHDEYLDEAYAATGDK